jgi:hypothetical protein
MLNTVNLETIAYLIVNFQISYHCWRFKEQPLWLNATRLMEFLTLQYQNQNYLHKFNEEFLTAASRFHIPANPIWTTFLSEYFAFLLSVWLQYRPIIIFIFNKYYFFNLESWRKKSIFVAQVLRMRLLEVELEYNKNTFLFEKPLRKPGQRWEIVKLILKL